MSDIVVDLTYVQQLHTEVSATITNLRATRPGAAGLLSDPLSDGYLDEFQHRWDKRRGELADTLDSVASALQAIYDTFNDTDTKLAGELTGGS